MNLTNFSELKLSSPLLESLKRLSFQKPTPIQAQAIPPIMEGRDVAGVAATGSGKTLAFSIPMIEFLNKGQGMALVLCPTRELGAQIETVLRQLLQQHFPYKTALLIGGTSMRQQLRALQMKPRIVIATPGRLLDHLGQRSLSLNSASFVVMDEADRMLDMGFAKQIDRIFKHLPRQRQTVLFSATFSKEAKDLIHRVMQKPFWVNVNPTLEMKPKIAQSKRDVPQDKKNDVLLDELNARQGSILIFARTQHRTDRLFKHLLKYGYSVSRIHGGRSQAQRNSAIKGFRDSQYRILVATDVAARGLDIPSVAHVINYDMPQNFEDYTHRIGRTGRAGAEGQALSLVTPHDVKQWKSIQLKSLGGTGRGRI